MRLVVEPRGHGRQQLHGERRRAHRAGKRKGHIGAAERLQIDGAPRVEQVAHRQRAEQFRPLQIDRDRHGHHLQHAAGVRPERRAGAAARGRPDVERRHRQIGAVVGRAGRRQPPAVAAADQDEIRTHLFEVIARNRLDRRRVAGLERRLELRQVGDQAGRARHALEQRRALLIHQARRFGQIALQLRLGLRGEQRADEIHGRPDRRRGEQRAGQEDPAAQRAETGNHGTTRSSSVGAPAATVMARCTRASPSYQPTIV